MNKYEQLIEHIINDETDKARELFHTIVVEKSRDIYESLIDEQDLEEVGGNEVESLVDEVTMDEQGISEEEGEEDEEPAEVGALDHDHEAGEEHEEAEIEDRVVDLEDALDELKAEFDALMAGEEHEEHEMPGIHGEEGQEDGEEASDEEFYEAKEEDEEDDEEDLEESIVREYVEKVADTGQKSASGKMAASGAHTPTQGETNVKSPVAGKNDMGGTAVTSKGGNANQDGTRPASAPKPKGELVSNPQNKPGADAGKTAFKAKETAKAGDGQTTDGKVAVNAKSPVAK